MRRLLLLVALAVTLLAPATATAASARCALDISPPSGSPTDVYRIAVSDVPVHPAGRSVEVRIDIRRLGSREGSVIFAFLIPGTTEFYVDYNGADPGEPTSEGLAPGWYRVMVSTPHIHGPCHAVDTFFIRG